MDAILCELFHPRMVNARTYLARMNNNRKKESWQTEHATGHLASKGLRCSSRELSRADISIINSGYPYGAPYAELVAPAYRLEDKRGLDIQFLKLKTWRDNP